VFQLLEWKDEYCIGHVVVDGEHKRLFQLANRILELADPSSTGEFDEVVKELFRYMEYHFRHEEELMESITFPHLEHHRAAHQRIVEEMSESLRETPSVKEYGQKLRLFMVGWVLQHVIDEDMQIKPYLPAA